MNTDSETIHALHEQAVSLAPITSPISTRPVSAGAPPKSDAGLEVIKAALLRHPAIQQAASAIAANGAQVRVNQAAQLPKVGVGLSDVGIGSYGSDEFGPEVTASQLVTDFGVTGLTIKESELETQRSYLEFQRSANVAAAEVLVLMSDVLRNRTLQELRSEQLNSMRALQKMVVRRREAGATSEPDTLEVERRIHSAEYQLFEARATLVESQSAVLQVAGIDFTGAELPAIEQADACSFNPTKTFDVRVARIEIVIAETALNRTERSRLPRVSIDAVAQQPIDGSEPRFGVGLNFGLNVFEGGAHSARVDHAMNTLKASQSGLERAVLDSGLVQSRWQRQIVEANQKTEILSRQISLLDSVRELYRSQYLDLGTRSLIELLDAEEDFFNLRGEEINVHFDHLNTGFECMERSGELLRSLNLGSTSLFGYPLNSSL